MELERFWAHGLGFQSASREAGAGGSLCLCLHCCQREPLAAVLSAPGRFRRPGLAVGWAAPAQIVTVKSVFNLYVQKMENAHLSPVISKAVPPYQQEELSSFRNPARGETPKTSVEELTWHHPSW